MRLGIDPLEAERFTPDQHARSASLVVRTGALRPYGDVIVPAAAIVRRTPHG